MKNVYQLRLMPARSYMYVYIYIGAEYIGSTPDSIKWPVFGFFFFLVLTKIYSLAVGKTF